MFIGAHVLLYSQDPDADRAFFRDVLEFPAVDTGHGWLIFALPPSEVALHPNNDEVTQTDAGDRVLGGDLYLMCEDVRAVMRALEAKRVACTAVAEERWGIRTSIRLPSGSTLGLYQPTHPTALNAARGM